MSATFGVIHTVASLGRDAGGPTVTVGGLCANLARLGLQIDLVTTRKENLGADDVVIPPADLVNTHFATARRLWPSKIEYAPGFRSKLRSVCHVRHPLIIHDHGIWRPNNAESVLVAKDLNLPIIVSPRGMLEQWAIGHKRFKKLAAWILYQRRSLRAVSLLHATSGMEAERFRDVGLRQPIAVVANGIEMPAYKSCAVNIKKAQRIMLFVSRIHPKKGLIQLVKAWKLVQPIGWKLVIAGPDEEGHLAEVRNLVRQYGLVDDISFRGAVYGIEKDNLFERSSVFVLPTFSENFGNVVLEALSRGLPVITTTGAPWADLQRRNCGWWVRPCVDDLAAAIRSASNMPERAMDDMSARALEYAQDYRWSNIADQMAATYAWVVGAGDKPDYVWLS